MRRCVARQRHGAPVRHGGLQRRVPVVLGRPADDLAVLARDHLDEPRTWRGAATASSPPTRTGSCPRSRRCCGRGWSGSSCASRPRPGSSRCRGRPGSRPRRGGPRRPGRRRARGRRSTGTRGGRRRSGTRSRVLAPAALRMMVRPASSKWAGRRSGRPAWGWRRANGTQQTLVGVRRRHSRPPRGGAEDRAAQGEEAGPPVAVGTARAPRPRRRRRRLGAGPGAARRRWRPQRRASGTAAATCPRSSGRPGAVGLGGGHQPELGHEAVVVARHLAVHAAREGVLGELLLEHGARPGPPSARLSANQSKANDGDELAGRLGDHVVVGRGPPAPEPRQVALVPPDLGDGVLVVARTVLATRLPARRAAAGSTPRR